MFLSSVACVESALLCQCTVVLLLCSLFSVGIISDCRLLLDSETIYGKEEVYNGHKGRFAPYKFYPVEGHCRAYHIEIH